MTARRSAVAGLAAVLLAGAGCDGPARPVGACTPLNFEGQRFTVCRATPAETRLEVLESDSAGQPFRSFAALRTALDQRHVAFAMNAGMFDEAGKAIGLLIVGGRRRHALNRKTGFGNFHMTPNGVFYGDATGWGVVTTDAFAARTGRHPEFATQSGPMLVTHGRLNPRFGSDGPSRYRRNGVGVDRAGSAWFAISERPVSFGRLARLFRERLGCPDALYLDGYVSSLWDPAARRLDDGSRLGPIVVALRKR